VTAGERSHIVQDELVEDHAPATSAAESRT
jgi:hypothetical protein